MEGRQAVEREAVFCGQIVDWKARAAFGVARPGADLVCCADQLRLQAGVIEGIAVVTGAIVVLDMQLDGAALHCHKGNQQIANPDGIAGDQVNVVKLHGRRTPV